MQNWTVFFVLLEVKYYDATVILVYVIFVTIVPMLPCPFRGMSANSGLMV